MEIIEVESLPVRQAGWNLEVIMQKISDARSKDADVNGVVLPILNDVKENGDVALKKYTEKFDSVDLDDLRVSKNEILEAYERVDDVVINALNFAKKNIEKFHKVNLKFKDSELETVPGVKLWREFRPIEKVGIYVPGGKAAYPSTLLMNVVPAKLAACEQIVICTPAGVDGKCNAALLVAADLCGIEKIFKVGGAQAVAAMAYGTESIPKVYKIFGPGNQYVSTAKVLLYGEVDIDMPAGPSELMIIADSTSARPAWLAADLLGQLEHGTDSQSILITNSRDFADLVLEQVYKQIQSLSRKNIIKESLKRSFILIVNDWSEAIEIANEYAPEHLQIIVDGEEKEILKQINNLGSAFLGKYSTEALGDYATGANHTLPTSGYAKMFAPLSLESFGKKIQVQKVSKKGIENLRETVEVLANVEGLDAHAASVSIRFKK